MSPQIPFSQNSALINPSDCSLQAPPNARRLQLLMVDEDHHDGAVVKSMIETICHTLQDDNVVVLSDLILSDEVLSEEAQPYHPLRHGKALLGSTINHLIFDTREGVSLDYLLSSLYAVKRGGSVWLIVPKNTQSEIYQQASTRFHREAIATPYFDQFFYDGLREFATMTLTPDSLPEYLEEFARCDTGESDHSEPSSEKPSDALSLSPEQKAILHEFTTMEEGIATLFAPRGVGKSVVGNALIEQKPHQYLLTAPNQSAISRYHDFRGALNAGETLFYAPDMLLSGAVEIDPAKTLIIDEAAKIPLAKLERLCALCHKTLLISSVENYEGTNQGLREKFYELVPVKKHFTLTELFRFVVGDAVSQLCDYLRFEGDFYPSEPLKSDSVYEGITLFLPDDWHADEEKGDNQICTMADFRQNRALFGAVYHLLNETHYQTNIQDIRRLFDDPESLVVIYVENGRVQGAIWGLLEGEIDEALAIAIYRGLRRPKGNLVPQMLGTHGYDWEPMLMRSVRISRISVVADKRREGLASTMIRALETHMKQIDFLSASFGLTESLLKFWEAAGFTWIHLGTHQDKTTALHAGVVMRALSKRGEDWLNNRVEKWQHDAYEWQYAPFIRDEIKPLLAARGRQGKWDEVDCAAIDATTQFKKPTPALFGAFSRQKRALNKADKNK
ncbi:GNAT family N-acetyltransferase [Ignatzschineria sp. RMDPL8A]|uniref:GNAT family N-acetyltransferase n=1 Tax=Ignatzschineria sp. RMDPL8A TaxID=2999236 RepID=UPI0024467437|nr:GNAT family N-acetyltransferase [Ignatzschineria sp. RMDPL8A]MDG9729157.1 GNAT family N-acetyltransferase [Ignatzschineria sp. RMDPL8A]